MAIFFDIRTISLFNGLISACLFVCLVHVYRKRKTYPGFRQWTLAYGFNFLGFFLLSLRNLLPDLITIVTANLLIVLCFVFLARGLVRFTGGRQNLWMDLSAPVAQVCSFLILVYLFPSLILRILVVGICLRCLRISREEIPQVLGERNGLLTISFMVVVVSLSLRVVLTLLFGGTDNDFMLASTIQGMSIIATAMGLILIAISLIIINAQRLEKELVTAGREIKTLRGFLPICSFCKKIRDDQGYWKQIESYIQRHSEASFSHGVCPECLEKFYGDEAWYREAEETEDEGE